MNATVFSARRRFRRLTTTFEGAGNGYALLWDTDDGRLRAGKIVDAVITDFLSPARYVTGSGWHTLRIEARENPIKYFLDDQLLIAATDTTFPSGHAASVT
jgi:membrane-associated phospholipid phosphatase